jgi:hypothetical protein
MNEVSLREMQGYRYREIFINTEYGWMEFISPGGTQPIGPKHANYIRIEVT